jgi:hypothetical protein
LGHTVILSKEDIEIALTKDSLNVECYPTWFMDANSTFTL